MLSPQLNYNTNYGRPSTPRPTPPVAAKLASMLLGIPAGSMGLTDSYVEQDKYFALYSQDDWKVSRKLTINLGLRYEHESPMTERYNRAAAQFAFGQSNPLKAHARANYTSPIPELPLTSSRSRADSPSRE